MGSLEALLSVCCLCCHRVQFFLEKRGLDTWHKGSSPLLSNQNRNRICFSWWLYPVNGGTTRFADVKSYPLINTTRCFLCLYHSAEIRVFSTNWSSAGCFSLGQCLSLTGSHSANTDVNLCWQLDNKPGAARKSETKELNICSLDEGRGGTNNLLLALAIR